MLDLCIPLLLSIRGKMRYLILPSLWSDGVVPITMETVGNEIHQGQFLVANFEARWIRARGQLRLDEDILRPPGTRDELSWWWPFSHLGWAALYAGLARG